MAGLTPFYIIAGVVIIGLIVYYLKQKGRGAGAKKTPETPEAPTSEGQETPTEGV